MKANFHTDVCENALTSIFTALNNENSAKSFSLNSQRVYPVGMVIYRETDEKIGDGQQSK